MSRRPKSCVCKKGKLKPHHKIVDCSDVAQIIDALTFEEEMARRMKKPLRIPKFKTKPFKPRHYKDTCVPMVPSMHTRLRYIGHCPLQPPCKSCGVCARKCRKFPMPQGSSDTDNIMKTLNKDRGLKKRDPYDDMKSSCNIIMPAPPPIIKHTASDKSILHVPSPKTSGEEIRAQRASVQPRELVPPIPAQSGFDLFQPHSGLVINRDKYFTPDVGLIPGPRKLPGDPLDSLPCYKGGPCKRKKCKGKRKNQNKGPMTKKQKKRAACLMRRQEKLGRMRRSSKRKPSAVGSDGKPRGNRRGPPSARGSYADVADERHRSRKNIPYGKGQYLGATDGKPRAKSSRTRVADDGSVCGLDEIPRADHVQIPANLKKGTFKTHSMTILPCTKERKPVHYGLLKGSFNMYDSKFGPRSRGRQALTMSVMAYCLAFHYHPKQWTMKLVDNLVNAGDQWYLQCLDKVHDHTAYQGICEVLPFGKKQTLVLNGKKMQVLLGEPDVVGYTMSIDPTIYNLCRGLKAFFKEASTNRAGVFLTRVLKVIIWRDKVCYYIFDPAGRDSRAYSNFNNGASALMNVKDIEAVSEVLLARTVLGDQKFVIAAVKVLRMVDEKADEDFESDKELTQAEKSMMGYRILNENCAIVNGNMHLGDRCFEDARFRQALTVAVAAMTYAKISPPNTWFTKTLDKILRLGNKLYVDCIHPKVMIDITIDNIPNEIIIGPYSCDIIIYRERVKGQLFTTKECLFNIKTGLADFFSHEYNSGILDFNNYQLAVWRQKEMYYMFDPYPRSNDGMRTAKTGRACCWMFLNTSAMADVFNKNWDYLPQTTQFYIHAFKVLKLKKREKKAQLVCTLSDDQLPGAKGKSGKKVLDTTSSQYGMMGDAKQIYYEVMPDNTLEAMPHKNIPDEEQMGDIVSLVDSIQEDYLPPIPLRYKNMGPEPVEPKVVNLDSPTVSVTQVIPPWPKPRDKANEPPEPDPDPEPTPPPTPPPPPPPEGGIEEEEEAEEEEDEETMQLKKEEAARKKAEEEEARRKAEELPPPMPPPPPSPSPSEPEVPLAPPQPPTLEDEEVQIQSPINVDRRILLTEDAQARFNLRKLRKKITPPLDETQLNITASQELAKPSNFKTLPDGTEMIRGADAITNESADNKDITGNKAADILPFAAIMAIVTSYKYTVSTWTHDIVDFIIDAAKKLYQNKQERFQLAPIHIIPKIAIGHQAYQASIDVAAEGPTWQLEDILSRKYLSKSDRGMLTTPSYSCAFFKRNNLYYLFDASACNAMGLREEKGKGCLLRFRNLHDLCVRVSYNKYGESEDQQFILSRIVVRRLLREPRTKQPDDYDYDIRAPKSKKSRASIVEEKGTENKLRLSLVDVKDKKSKASAVELKDKDRRSSIIGEVAKSSIFGEEAKSKTAVGYQLLDKVYKIEGTTSLKDRNPSPNVKACHFVSLIAMLMATMYPIRIWDHVMVDICIEKGLEIHEKATNFAVCEKRVIKNVLLNGKFMNLNIKKIMVVNENPIKTLEQYLRAVMQRLRYVIIRFPTNSMVICNIEGYYHLFDPYAAPSPPPPPPPPPPPEEPKSKDKAKSKDKTKKTEPEDETPPKNGKGNGGVASWTLYPSIEALASRLIDTAGPDCTNPEFYTFELTSVKRAPRHSAFNYRLSPLFKPDENPNVPYLKRKKTRPIIVDEKMYWLNVPTIPWSRLNTVNDLGLERKTPKTMWKDWDIEFPGDLYSLWGSLNLHDTKFSEENRGLQYLATCVVAIVMTQKCPLSAWTGSYLDGIVNAGDKYHQKCLTKLGSQTNYEFGIKDLDAHFAEMYPYTFDVKFDNIIFGFVYNIYPDRFNLSKALTYFFEKNTLGILTSPTKNLAFGKIGPSYFMYDCQSYGSPLYSPGQGASYILKCESLNRLIYCITLTLNITRHGQQFHLYSVEVKVAENNSNIQNTQKVEIIDKNDKNKKHKK